MTYICSPNAEIAQLVEHNLAKVGVASSSLVFRSKGFRNEAFFRLDLSSNYICALYSFGVSPVAFLNTRER